LYSVFLVAGDASTSSGTYRYAVEGVLTINGTVNSANRWVAARTNVSVTDGRLTLANASGASNNKVCFLELARLLPTLVCPPDKTVECGTDWAFDPPSGLTDACTGGSVFVRAASTVTNFGAFCDGTYSMTRTWAATDACGNTTQCSQTVQVSDLTPPAITCPADQWVDLHQAWEFDPPTATDLCGEVILTADAPVTNAGPRGAWRVTRAWTATDGCGNAARCWQTVWITNRAGVTLSVADATGQSQAEVLVPVCIRGFAPISTLQFSLRWDASVGEFMGVEEFGLPGLEAGNFETERTAEGILTVSWDDPAGGAIALTDGTALFAVRIRLVGLAGTSGRVWLDDVPVPIEVADEDLAPVFVSAEPGHLIIAPMEGP
jgi:hypothetical protein